jgi:hypothetical protein
LSAEDAAFIGSLAQSIDRDPSRFRMTTDQLRQFAAIWHQRPPRKKTRAEIERERLEAERERLQKLRALAARPGTPAEGAAAISAIAAIYRRRAMEAKGERKLRDDLVQRRRAIAEMSMEEKLDELDRIAPAKAMEFRERLAAAIRRQSKGGAA